MPHMHCSERGTVSLKVACYATDEKITFLDLKEFKGNIYNR